MKKVIKKTTVSKAQTGGSFDKKVTRSIKLDTPYAKSDSVRAKEMSNYKQLRAMGKRGSTVAAEPAVFDATKAQYTTARHRQTVSNDKNGGIIKKKKK